MGVIEQLHRMDWLQWPLWLAGPLLVVIAVPALGRATPIAPRTTGMLVGVGVPLFVLGWVLGPPFSRSTPLLLAALAGLVLLALALGRAALAARRRLSDRALSWGLVLVLLLDLGYLVAGYPLLYGMTAPHAILMSDCPGDPACIDVGQWKTLPPRELPTGE